jgi:hypothetical protein
MCVPAGGACSATSLCCGALVCQGNAMGTLTCL